jgi:TPR repeat protein
VLFHEAIQTLHDDLEEAFALFERAAAKGHEEAIWIMSVVKDVQLEKDVWKEAFAMTEEPLGWWFAGQFTGWGRERFNLFSKSAKGGCSWGQLDYAWYLKRGHYVGEDKKAYLELMEKAAKQNNPVAMSRLGDWCSRNGAAEKTTAFLHHVRAAQMGWKDSLDSLAEMLKHRKGCGKESRQAVKWSAEGNAIEFWEQLGDARVAFKQGLTEDLDGNFNQMCFILGWGLYWYVCYNGEWDHRTIDETTFGLCCLNYYCSCVELQQKSIFTFLLYWNQRSGGVKGPGQMIGKIVWEGREDNLVKGFGSE